ncbi:hypothetical protein BFAG_03753 [Bacteroides fragilis 3_1_12]|uniref:Uncharacterized protein n=1 Tax=Bacteroides fragilis 3_1_12 TaxID=457424 RepID=A0ABN0BQ69_BACFG|nr:hypothetical protein BFAG_03753 [Bacteroides fragilis 3_1_12]
MTADFKRVCRNSQICGHLIKLLPHHLYTHEWRTSDIHTAKNYPTP